MKKIFVILLFVSSLSCFGQDKDHDLIKLFIDLPGNDIPGLTSQQKNRLLFRITQLVNHSGVAEIGYSNFIVYPNFDILDVQYSEAGIQKIYVAKCELGLYISRRSYDNDALASKIGAVYSSYLTKVSGTGYTKEEAVNNAVNNIDVENADIIEFINKSKQKIIDYFNKNCANVIKEADQAKELKDYGKAISLYFSIPQSCAACYEEAKGKSVGVYKSYLENKCRKDKMRLTAILASVHDPNDPSEVNKYTEAINIFSNLEPGTECFKESEALLASVEKKFNQEQKQQWDYRLKGQKASADLQVEMVKQMALINASYRPANSPANIYISTDGY